MKDRNDEIMIMKDNLKKTANEKDKDSEVKQKSA